MLHTYDSWVLVKFVLVLEYALRFKVKNGVL